VARVDALRSVRLRAAAPCWRVRVVAAFLAVVERFVAAVRPTVLRGLAAVEPPVEAAVERAVERFVAAVRPPVVRGLAGLFVRVLAVFSAMWILVPSSGK
jgi:hypothetical protein